MLNIFVFVDFSFVESFIEIGRVIVFICDSDSNKFRDSIRSSIRIWSCGRSTISGLNLESVSLFFFAIEFNPSEDFSSSFPLTHKTESVTDFPLTIKEKIPYFKMISPFISGTINNSVKYFVVWIGSIFVNSVDLSNFGSNFLSFQHSFLFSFRKQWNFIIDIF